MSQCPICQCPLTDKEAEWSADGNHRCHLVCVDALVFAMLDIAARPVPPNDRIKGQVASIMQSLFQSARQVLVASGAI